MKRFFLPLLLVCTSAFAAPNEEKVNFFFESVKLNELARVMYVDMMGKSYMFESEFLNDQTAVGFTFRQITKSYALQALNSLLEAHGMTVTLDRGVYSVRRKEKDKSDEMEDFFYRPKYRTSGYITDLVSSLFEKGRFSYQRPVKNPAMTSAISLPQHYGAAVQGQVNQPQGQPVQGPQIQDTGTSAYSQLSKDVDVLIFHGPAKEIARLQKLLVQIDTPSGQVLVRAHVYEVTTGAKEGSAFALALNLISKGSPGSDGLTKWAYRLGDLNKSLGNSVTVGNATIEGIFTALASDNRFKVVSSPSLRVKGGTNARFSVGSDVPVLGTVQVDKNGNPVQSVEYKPSGVILDIQPRIMENEIELTINQQLSSFIPTTTGVNNSPTLTKREIKTTIGAIDGDVIVLGGLDESKSSNDSTGLPYLPRFLRANGQEDNKTELLLVMEVQKI